MQRIIEAWRIFKKWLPIILRLTSPSSLLEKSHLREFHFTCRLRLCFYTCKFNSLMHLCTSFATVTYCIVSTVEFFIRQPLHSIFRKKLYISLTNFPQCFTVWTITSSKRVEMVFKCNKEQNVNICKSHKQILCSQ